MNKRFSLLLLLVICYLTPIWFSIFLPFVDLPQHLSFVFVLKNWDYYQPYFQTRLFPMHNTFHLFFNYLFSQIIPLEVSNRIFVSLIIILTPLALYFLITTLKGEAIFSLLGFLVAYNYNLFWGFMGIAFALPVLIFLLTLQIRLFLAKEKEKKGLYLFLIALLFVILFLCHSLVFIFGFVAYLLIDIFLNRQLKERVYHLLPPLMVTLLFFLPWQLNQFQKEGSELFQHFKESISFKALYENLIYFWERLGIRSDALTLFFYKLITLFAVFLLVRERKMLFRSDYLPLSIFFLSALAFYLFFPGSYIEAVFLNERFAPLIFLILIVYLSLFVKEKKFSLFLIFILLFLQALNLNIRFSLFNQDGKGFKKLISRLEPDRKVVGVLYTKRPAVDYFGYDVFLHFPNYYQIYKKGFPAFSFAYIPYSPLIFKETYPLPRINEWFPWRSIFPYGYEHYDYIITTGEIRLSDERYFRSFTLIDSVGIWKVYAIPDSLKEASEIE